MSVRDGDGWVQCRCGQRHWGRHGAAGLLLLRTTGGRTSVLLQHRADWVHDGGTWALPGGARDSHEDDVAAALREAAEETGVSASDVVVTAVMVGTDHVDWRYSYVLAEAEEHAAPYVANEESAELRWLDSAAVADLPLHPALARDWPRLLARVVADGRAAG